jgi:pyruvate dehydrogenase E2 component (dihydrolipoyllysine-residue acetyltransferase)
MPIEIRMPALSPTMKEGNLARWLKQEGDMVESGDIIAEIETDKATMEVEAVDEGVLGRILVPGGTENVVVNDIIALLLEEDEDPSTLDNFNGTAQKIEAAIETAVEQPKTKAAPSSKPTAKPNMPSQDTRIFATPLAKRIAADKGIDLNTVQGTGPRGRIIKRDIENFKPIAMQPAQNFDGLLDPPASKLIPHTMMRKTIAKRLLEAKQTVPHFYLTIECEIDRLMALRQEFNEARPEGKISVNDMIIKASALALMKVPTVNSSWTDEGVRQFDAADVAVAVAIDGGLVTPVIRRADLKNLGNISVEMKALAAKARAGKLMPEEYQNGTFSISNLGMFGIKEFSAIINPPQGAILAVGAGRDMPIVKDGELTISKIMTCTLSVDHRVIDGAAGAEFLKVFKELIESPLALIL